MLMKPGHNVPLSEDILISTLDIKISHIHYEPQQPSECKEIILHVALVVSALLSIENTDKLSNEDIRFLWKQKRFCTLKIELYQ